MNELVGDNNLEIEREKAVSTYFRKRESTQLKGVHNSHQTDPLPLPNVVYRVINKKMVFVHLTH
jgi:hypothetical protein